MKKTSTKDISCMIESCNEQYEMFLMLTDFDKKSYGYELCNRHYDYYQNKENRENAIGKSGRLPREIEASVAALYKSIPEHLRMFGR